ncbi:MAG: transposase [Candidatus Eremiobacteraeota bacterium]|nr:transposase [Candidatus Eremiobacteraeota bacterium]
MFIEPGSPWENGYIESFNGKLRDECLNGELFLSRTEAKYVVERWRQDYNHHRPHSRLGWQTPASFAASCKNYAKVYNEIDRCIPPGFATLRHTEYTRKAYPTTLIQTGT